MIEVILLLSMVTMTSIASVTVIALPRSMVDRMHPKMSDKSTKDRTPS